MKKLWNGKLAGGRESTVLIADDLNDLSLRLGSYGRDVLWVFDTNTSNMFRQMPPNNVILEDGEANKNLKSLTRIISSASQDAMERDSRFIGFGGGVVCDMTALAASLYMRGCRLTLVPTTLLCMCDACLGGKTAIDYAGVKNLIGSFYPADEILICLDTLRTLGEREFINGLGEVIKHAVLSPDTELYKLLISRGREIVKREGRILTTMVERSLEVKLHFLEKDPEESRGIRQMLNLGHTFGHALEGASRFRTFSHGECVAWGTCRALEAGVALGLTDRRWADGVIKLFSSFGYQVDYRIGRGDWIAFNERLSRDKKNVGGKVNFVIPVRQGECRLMPLDQSLIRSLVIAHY